MESNILHLIYLFSSVSFIVGLKMLSSPKTARRGNFLAACGMVLAILATVFLYSSNGDVFLGNRYLIFAAIALGSVLGFFSAKKVKMTDMPQMVSLFNGMGGACAAAISLMEFSHLGSDSSTGFVFVVVAGLVIGSVSFSGSIVAYLKLQEILKSSKRIPGHNFLTIGLLIGIVIFMMVLSFDPVYSGLFYLLFFLSLTYGVFFVLPIGGADMPVVISLLNSFTGIAAALGGFLYNNPVMQTGGILVGSAGTFLTILMCNAMNRSLSNVLFGSFGGSVATDGSGLSGSEISIRPTTAADVAMIMHYAQKVIIIPGYGLAVAQAQHVIHEIEMLLEKNGVIVKYAIHPVAGRMPGHMNVLLAEANIPYEKLVEMDEINDEFAQCDVCLVIGANDVVNPAARTNPASPIYGMPILNADKARTIIVSKRGMAAGYAGIENELFGYDNCLMLFGDAKKTLTTVVSELKSL